jgi:hypothetical protein
MTLRKGMLATAASLGIALIAAQLLGAQQVPPTEGKGQTVRTIASLELGA